MKAHQSSLFMMAILLVMPVFNLSLNVLAAHQDETAATLRGNAVMGQEERILAKGGGGGGGNGGGGQNKNNESITPAPTPASTPAPTSASTPAPSKASTPQPTGYQPVDPASCSKLGFTRAPTTPQPTPTPAPPPSCVNPSPGTCGNKGPYCCDGWTCSKGKNGECVEVRRNLRVEQAKSFPFQTSAADARHRELDQCTDANDSCNVNDNPIICTEDIPSNAADHYSVICNYNEDGAEYKADVDRCESDSVFCCDDGNGGFYYPVGGCWGTNAQCCPKGYTKNLFGNGCIPLNCCDWDDFHRGLYCPQCF